MSSVSENGILDKRDFEAFKHRTVESKFKHQLFLGLGGATVFGLVGAFGKALLDVAMGSVAVEGAFLGMAATGWAWIGLAAIAVAGVACVYMGSKFLSESILMDQDFQAKKIALATQGHAHGLVQAPVVEPTKTVTTPPGMAVSQDEITRNSTDNRWTDKFAQRQQSDLWAEEVRLNEAGEDQIPQRLH